MTARFDTIDAPVLDTGLGGLRRRVLEGVVNVLAIGVPLVSVVIVLQAMRHGELGLETIVLCTYTLVFPLLRLARSRLGFRASALALLGLLTSTTAVITSRGGVAVGSVVLSILSIMLGAIFFGRRGAALALLSVVGVFAITGAMLVTGLLPPVSLSMWDPNQVRFWLRETIAIGLCGLAIAVAQTYIVERLVSEANTLSRLVDLKHKQRLELERAEREREHEREQRKLAQQALEESRRIEALARLAGGIAHDFNNALTVIMGAAEMLKWDGTTRAQVMQSADDVMRAARGAAELTRQLLTLGRRHVSKPQPVNMGEFLARLSAAARRVLPTDISLQVEVEGTDVTACVTPIELQRALFNLVLNAGDAMPDGGTLNINCGIELISNQAERLSAGRYVVLTVSDDGQGMDAATMDRIFDPFFTTKGPGKGTGLGLATVHAFVTAAGGDIRVRSDPGVGTTFTLFLPSIAEPGAARDNVPERGARYPEELGRRVLVVEDQADVRASMVRILTGNGFQTLDVPDGDRAIEVLSRRGDFALMCIDGVMPGTGTAAVLERAAELSPKMPVLICSGYVEQDLVRRGISLAQYGFLAKPFSSEQLLDSVHCALLSVTTDGAGEG
jgi:signal transduction histidine kinase/ActR/RegA family two-component response regulator